MRDSERRVYILDTSSITVTYNKTVEIRAELVSGNGNVLNPQKKDVFFDNIKDLKIYPVFISHDFFKVKNNNIHLIGDAFFAFPPSFAQGASQSIEGAYELFENIENNTESNFFRNRVNKTKMVNNRSKFNQFAFHLSNPLTTLLRNIFLKKLVKNKKFLEGYLGKIYKN